MKKFLSNVLQKSINLLNKNDVYAEFGDWITLKSGKQNSSWVSNCVNVWGAFNTKAKFRLYTKQRGILYEVLEHPFIEIQKRPNDFQTSWEQKYDLATHWTYWGKVAFLKLRDRMDVWRQTIMLEPSRISPVRSKTKFISHYEYDMGIEKINLPIEDVIYLRFPNADNSIAGKPLINNIISQIEVDQLQSDYQRKFYKEGGFMGLTFSSDKEMSKLSFDRAVDQLQKKFGQGTENSYKVAVFEAGLKPIKAAYSIKDMDIAEQRKLSMQEILSTFRIPQILIGGVGGDYNRATADAAIYAYTSAFVDPMLDFVDEKLSLEVQKEFDKTLYVKHDSLAPRDIENELKFYKDMTSMGALTINEIRTEQDWEPFSYPLADRPLLNLGGAAIDIATGEQLGATPSNRVPEKKKDFEEDLIWKRFISRHVVEGEFLKRELSMFFKKQEEQILKMFKSDEMNNFFIDQDLLLQEVLRRRIIRILDLGFKYGESQVGEIGLINYDSTTVRTEMLNLMNHARGINETTRVQLLAAIGDRQLTNEEIARRVKDEFEDISSNRIPKIVNTTVTGGLNAGAMESFRKAGVKNKKWISERDSRTRDSHIISNGQVKGLEELFEVGQDKILYPGDPRASAKEAVNCRCTIFAIK